MVRKKKRLMNNKNLMMPKMLHIKLQLKQLNRRNMMRKWKIVQIIKVKKMKVKVKKKKILTQEKKRKDIVTNVGLLEKNRKLMLESTKMVLMKPLTIHFSMKISMDLGILLLKLSYRNQILKLPQHKDLYLTMDLIILVNQMERKMREREVKNILMNLLDLLVFALNANKLKRN